MTKKRPEATFSFFNDSVSLESFPCINGHKLFSTPIMPLSIAIEYLYLSSDLMTLNHPHTTVCNFKNQRPLLLKNSEPQDIVIEISSFHDKHQKKEIDILSSGKDLFFKGEVIIQKSAPKVEESKEDKEFKFYERGALFQIGASAYKEALPYGLHFQNVIDVTKFEDNYIEATQSNLQNDLTYIRGLRLSSLATNPLIIEGIVQLCTVHIMAFENFYVLPTHFETLYINHPAVKKASQVFTIIEPLDSLTYNVKSYHHDGTLILAFSNLSFEKIKMKIPDIKEVLKIPSLPQEKS